VEIGSNLPQRIAQFRELPYKHGEFKRRNWGHPLHSLCSYPSKIKPSIAHILVTYFTERGETILDEFSGSGTIPLEACLNGRKGIGSDLSPLAFHLTRAKVDPPTKEQVASRIEELKNFLESEKLDENELSLVPNEIRSFYEQRTMQEILQARKFLAEQHRQDNVSSFLIGCTAHLLHGNRPYALSRRSHNMFPIPPKGEFKYKSLIEALSNKVDRTLSEELPNEFTRGEVFQVDATRLPLLDGQVSAVITSPSFLGTTDFLRHNRIRLWFCGWNYEEQELKKPQFLEQASSIEAYRPIFGECKRVLREKGLAIIHLGVVRNRDMGTELLPLAEDNGFERIGIVYEDTTQMETYGRTDRGSTHKHEFLFLRKQT
jgi:hypothetical protein